MPWFEIWPLLNYMFYIDFQHGISAITSGSFSFPILNYIDPLILKKVFFNSKSVTLNVAHKTQRLNRNLKF